MTALCPSALGAWLGGQSCLMPRTHRNQIKARQHSAETCGPPCHHRPALQPLPKAGHRHSLAIGPGHTAWTEDVIQGPNSHVVELQWEPPQCESIQWSDGDKKKQSGLAIMKRLDSGDSREEEQPGHPGPRRGPSLSYRQAPGCEPHKEPIKSVKIPR